MKVNEIPIKQNANQVTDPNTQVSAEEFNALVDNAKESVTSMEVLAGKEEVKLSYGKGKGTTPTLTFPNATAAGAGMMSPKQAARIADRTASDGMGYVVLDKDKTFAEQVTHENTIYEIRYDFDLGGQPKEIPAGCVLKFEGGCLKNGTIVGDNSVITSTGRCLKEVYVLGTWNCTGEVKWWCETSGFVETSNENNPIDVTKVDCTRDFQYALDSDFSNLYVDGLYYITSTLNLAKPKDIEMAGYTASTYLRQHQKDLVGKTFVFTDKDITLLRIAPELLRNGENQINFSSRVSIRGGNFDASLATIYSSNCIEVDIREDRKLWGFEFDSGVWGAYTSWGVLPGGCGIKFLTDENNGYATMVNIKGNVEWFGTGLYIVSGVKCWITDIALSGVISNCPTALTADADMSVHASIQPRCFFTEKNNGHPLVEVLGKTVVIDGMIWDVGTTQTYDEIKYYANSSAIDIRGGNVILEGRVAHYYKGSTRITGHTESLHADYSMTDKEKAFTHEQLLFNSLEGFLLKGGTCSIKLKDSNGSSLSGLNILQDINRLFSYTDSRVELQLESYNPDDGRYVEIKLEGFGPNYSIIHDVTLFFDRPTNTAPFAEYEIEWQYSNSSWNTYRSGIVQTKGYATGGQISEFSKVSASCTAIIIRLKKISAPITLFKLIATTLKTFYYNYNPAFLPVSGGTVYGETIFNKAKIETLEVGTLITDSEDTASPVPAITREVGTGSIYTLFNIQNNVNPVCSYSMFMLSTAEGIAPPKASLYMAEVVGYTGDTKLTLRKVWGSLDVEFIVYKKTDINANYIVCVDNTSATFYRMNCVFLDNSANASMLKKTIASVEEDGYSTYSFTMHNNKGATSARPLSTYITNGECYFDTDLGKPIWWNGTAWVDAAGTEA